MPWETWTSPNAVVAANLVRARKVRDWTQEEAAEHLEPYIGSRWSRANFSAAERGARVDPDDPNARIRNFTADDLVALSLAFDLPLMWWFLPPDDLGERTNVHHPAATEGADRSQLLTLAVGVAGSTEVRERIGDVGEVIEEQQREEHRRKVEELRGELDELRGATTDMQEEAAQLSSRIEELEDELEERDT